MKAPALVDQYFIGRESHLEEFKSFISREKDYRVLFIHGPGGIGKTWLLRKMIAAAHEGDHPGLLVVDDLIDMYSTAVHSIEGLQERLIALLEGVLGRSAFERYLRSKENLEKGIQERYREEILDSMRQGLQKDFIEDCLALSQDKKVLVFLDTFERVQRDQVGKRVLAELARQLPDFLFVIASQEPWGGNTYICSRNVEGFSPKEAQEYFEVRGWGNVEPKVRNVILEKVYGHPLKIELALEFLSAGWIQDIDKLHGMDEDEFEKALIAPLLEMGQGLFGSRDFDLAVHQVILFMAYFNRRFNAELLQRLIEHGAIDLLGLQPEDVLRKLEQEFFFVKTRPDGYIQLHDEMERLVNKHLWPRIDPIGDFRRELAGLACEWYEEMIQGAREEETTLDDLKAEQLIYLIEADLDKAYALLNGYGYDSFVLNNLLVVEIKPNKIKGLPADHRYPFAVDLGERARRVYLYEGGREYWQIAIESARRRDDPEQIIAALLGKHNCTHPDDPRQSLEILQEALSLCNRAEKRRAEVLYEMGFTYRLLQDILQAIRYYEKAKDAAPNKAMMAMILNDLGYAYIYRGDYNEAMRNVKQALDLRQRRVNRLEEQIASSEGASDVGGLGGDELRGDELKRKLADARWELGLSFNTLGEIKRYEGDLSAATGAYSEALELFGREDVNDFLWLARALYSRGEAHRRLAELMYSQNRFRASEDFEKKAEKDLQDSLNLCDQYRLKEKYTAYRRLGRLRHDQAKRESDPSKRLELLKEAGEYFQKGLQAAEDDQNTLEEFENLTELAFLVDDRLEAYKQESNSNLLNQEQIDEGKKDIKRLRDALDRHREDSIRIYQFPVFEHLLELEEGAFRFVQGQFDEALDFYLKGYAGLASIPGYGVARYRQHLGHLFDQLKKLEKLEEPGRPKEETVIWKWGDAFKKTWEDTRGKPIDPSQPEQTLAQLHPRLVKEIQIYLETAFLPEE